MKRPKGRRKKKGKEKKNQQEACERSNLQDRGKKIKRI